MSGSAKKLSRILCFDQDGQAVMDTFALLTDGQFRKIVPILESLVAEGLLRAYRADAYQEMKQLHIQMLSYEALQADLQYLASILRRGPSMSGPKDWSPVSELTKSLTDRIARTFFVLAWADAMEERGRSFSGMELFDVAPITPPVALAAAKDFIRGMVKANGMSMDAMFVQALVRAGVENNRHVLWDFGYTTAMQALGTGIRWTDDYKDHGLKIPSYEFTKYDLSDEDLGEDS